MRILRFTLCFIALSICFNANAATLHITGSGQLTGASNVDVDGSLYDVSFQEGSCNTLFSGCTTFAFTSSASANTATSALQYQVLLDVFDTSPEKIAGIEATNSGSIFTPYAIAENGDVKLWYANMQDGGTPNIVSSIEWDAADNLLTQSNYTYAIWSTASPVPIPAAAWLFGSALLGLAAMKRKKA